MVGTQLREIIKKTKPDVIHTHLIRMASYTAHLHDVPRVLDMTDAVTLYLKRFEEREQSRIKRILLRMELHRMNSYEHIISRFDRGLVCSETDMHFLQSRVPDAKLALLYNGIDLETFTPDSAVIPSPYRMIFSGNMGYFPNADAATYFVKSIFPIIKRRVPQAQVYIVGQNPPRRVRALASIDVIVTGFVPDLRMEYLKSAVAISPVRFGAGTLNKVLEPLALGVPVVTSSIGLEGLHLLPSQEILVADTANDFADHVCRLLNDPIYRKKIGSAAVVKIRNRLSWKLIAHDLENVYEQVIAEHRVKNEMSGS
jgi:glycosyltransferase involved in cell wall biosynthesis